VPGSLNLLEPSGPVKACNGIALPSPFFQHSTSSAHTQQLLQFIFHAISSLQSTFELNSHFIYKLLGKLVCFYEHAKIMRHKISFKMPGLSEKMW
jgi:hypothetical protein